MIMSRRLHSSCVRSDMLHGSETWPVRKENVVALQRAEMRLVRWMCGVKLKAVVKVGRGLGGLSPPCFDFGGVCPPLLESEPSLPTAGPKLLNSTKNHNVRCRINKF